MKVKQRIGITIACIVQNASCSGQDQILKTCEKNSQQSCDFNVGTDRFHCWKKYDCVQELVETPVTFRKHLTAHSNY